ncbi:MAG: type 2 isopentenyl-diphosphate Delta-isomerase [Candidatus Eremiobacteraeota bacterium]|nr:type 2 isopentenyl-diphosphate Delta-isomerase [Candidatus Eremiobacteraeota bacterium]
MSQTDLDNRAARELQANGAAGNGVPSRKADHIRINLKEDVAAKGVDSGFDEYRFIHRALPEVNLDEVNTSTQLFGRRLAAPLFISCMTGGTDEARKINRNLALVAQDLGLALGVGSGRAMLEHPELADSFDVRPHAPDALLFANLGAVQLNRGYGAKECRKLVSRLRADALVLHLNALQEALQPAGDTCFAGLLAAITELCAQLDVPVVVKEVGWGIAPDLVRALLDAGVSAVDVAGAGGTSWSEVERHRISDPLRQRVAAAFSGWGISTAESLRDARRIAPDAKIFASGGIRSGIDVAKAIALGADLVGMAGPFLRVAATGFEVAHELAREIIEVLRISMFSVGARSVSALRRTPWLRRRGDSHVESNTGRLQYSTAGAGTFLDITNDVAEVVRSSGVRDGVVHVYSTHTTAAVRVNENEQLLLRDFARFLERLAPAGNGEYEHDDFARRVNVPPDEPINGHAHCRHLLLSSSEMVPLVDGRLELGRWQRIFLVELCSPRDRTVVVQVLGR